MVNDIKLCVPGLICHIQRNQILLLKLKALKKWHLRVSDTVQMLNTIFGLQLLAIIVMAFTNVTFDIYSDVVRWQDGFISFDMHFFHMFYSPIPYYVIKMALLVWACETGKNQAQEISTTVHDLLNNIKDEQIKNELQLFSLQILHHKNTFLAKGFTIDTALLTAIMGKITTYLIITIQFLNMSHSCDRETAVNVNQSNYRDT
ncbi:PREDICTED: putative gustatory receptor 28b [Trachymyrmex cornetzi]|uniref:putative gustatory receptor 28b n=1 Tax=Trachymyrmex cornetzi TaxID=471704 RepID=UPI00084EDB8C|nr:PREDICTED: putative gustatory receptor 28b [Trachymyrmex cornetzi]